MSHLRSPVRAGSAGPASNNSLGKSRIQETRDDSEGNGALQSQLDAFKIRVQMYYVISEV